VFNLAIRAKPPAPTLHKTLHEPKSNFRGAWPVDEAPKARVGLSELLGGLAINKTLLSRSNRTTPILAAFSVRGLN
jgi:hypothetical protein